MLHVFVCYSGISATRSRDTALFEVSRFFGRPRSLSQYYRFLDFRLVTTMRLSNLLAAVTASSAVVGAFPSVLKSSRQLPAEPKGVTTIKSPSGTTIRYKQPGKAGICETTPGVNSYSGYIDLAPDVHAFFWFFESR